MLKLGVLSLEIQRICKLPQIMGSHIFPGAKSKALSKFSKGLKSEARAADLGRSGQHGTAASPGTCGSPWFVLMRKRQNTGQGWDSNWLSSGAVTKQSNPEMVKLKNKTKQNKKKQHFSKSTIARVRAQRKGQLSVGESCFNLVLPGTGSEL